ncbi:MAG: Xaa-Pro dipeptidase [Deltaproteobacteria bacterium]|nr:Xaa-Pro dipeptidase [Deltaproteobacteria bacterium]
MNEPMLALYADHLAVALARSEATLERHRLDALILDAGDAVARSRFDDQWFAYRPAAHFAWWLPLHAPGSCLLLRPGRRPTLYWHDPQSYWEAPPPPSHHGFAAHMDVHLARQAVALHAETATGRAAVVGESEARARALAPNAAWNPPDLVADLDAARTLKTPYEIACLAEANARAARGHDHLRQLFAAGSQSELDLHLDYLRATWQDDAETPYKNIVALDAHAATLHHIAYGRGAPAGASSSLLVDAGATCHGYHADITRTWVRGSGEAADRFRALVRAVDDLQQQLCDAIAIGTPYEALHDRAHLLVGEALRQVGLVHASAEAAVAKEVTFAFFPHGLGHSLGLQTHDVGCARIRPRSDNPWLRNTSTIAEGQVFTIEPGIYFIEGLLGPLRACEAGRVVDWRLVESLRPFGGVRIEDDVVVDAARGHLNLTRAVLPEGGGNAR